MAGRILGVLALAATLGACNSTTKPDTKWSDPTTITYYSALHVNIARMTKTARGVFYWDSIPSSDTVKVRVGDQLTVNYALWLPDGTLVDQGAGANVTLDTLHVIPGWVEGLTGAAKGSTRQLVVPPNMAYGTQGSPPAIPGNASLVFLVAVKSVTHPSSDVARVNAIARALEGSGAAARLARQAARFR